MDKQRKWAGLIIAAVVAAVGVTALSAGGSADAKMDRDLQTHEGLFRQLFPYAGEGMDAFERMTIEAKDGLEMAYTVLRGGEPLGYAVKQTVQGYGGPIELIVGIRPDGTLAGIHVGGADFNETEGLGAKAKEASFTDQFIGKHVPLTLGQDIDGISGATVTSTAIIDGVNAAAAQMKPHLKQNSGIIQQDVLTANASVIGYGGPVLVRLTLDTSGAIQKLDVGGVRFMETEGVGSRVKEDSFTSLFISKVPPLALGQDIDAVSGATISSRAVVDAVNEAAVFLAQNQ
ncbi:MAG: FMN-binding protein [Clostridia bacterium]|nr:FMN-binding protein [Clostridia bacterium]